MKKPSWFARVGPWGVVGLLWVATLFRDMDRNVLATLREPILGDVPMTEGQFGLVASAFMWVYGLISPVCGFLSDRYGRRRIIFVSVLTWSAVTWLTGQMHSFHGLFLTRALMGLSEACYLPAALALITDYHRATRARAVAVHNSGIYLGAALGGLGGYVAIAIGWRQCYSLLGLFGIAYAFVLMPMLRDAPVEAPAAGLTAPGPIDIRGAWRELSVQRGFWKLALVNGLLCVGSATIATWMPTFFRERFHLGIGLAGASSISYLQVGYFVSGMLGGLWSDLWARRNPRGRMLVPAVGFCLAAPGLLLVSVSPALGLALLGIGFYALARGFFDVSTMPIMRELIAGRYIATGYGLVNLVGSFTGAAMVTLSGVLRDHGVGLQFTFQLSAVALLLGALLLFGLRPRGGPATIGGRG